MRWAQGVAAMIIGLAACGGPVAENADLDAQARALYADITQGREAAILARMSSINPREQVRAQVAWLRGLTPPDPPPTPTVTGRNAYDGEQGERYSVVHEYAYPDRDAVMHTAFIREGDAWKVEYFNVNVALKTGAPEIAVLKAPSQG